jgi:acetyl-CoA decarbonylase/synthase complex subunit epsilon
MTSTAVEIAKCLKEDKNILLLTGALCDNMEIGGKRLVEYAGEIAELAGIPVAATGNTIAALVERDIKTKKVFAGNVINYMRAEKWEDPIAPERPETLVFIGYYPSFLNMMLSSLKVKKTICLDNVALEEVTLSPPDMNIDDWEKFLNEIINELKKK